MNTERPFEFVVTSRPLRRGVVARRNTNQLMTVVIVLVGGLGGVFVGWLIALELKTEQQPTKEQVVRRFRQATISRVVDSAAQWPHGIQIEHVELTPVAAEIDLPVTEDALGMTAEATEEQLILTFRVSNLSSVKRLHLEGWHGDFLANCRATDEHGNLYRPISYMAINPFVGDYTGKTLGPEEFGDVLVFFEKPIVQVSRLTIELNGGGVGLHGKKFRWTIDRRQWNR